ncbi:hypothetical protein SDC9_21338 [bioreactor metagenome]|uniref:Uncharacterized protein n=1 Tax=bioreactor metagenome TaxID=1076179 RepID=A0A644U993_9ZZZZ
MIVRDAFGAKRARHHALRIALHRARDDQNRLGAKRRGQRRHVAGKPDPGPGIGCGGIGVGLLGPVQGAGDDHRRGRARVRPVLLGDEATVQQNAPAIAGLEGRDHLEAGPRALLAAEHPDLGPGRRPHQPHGGVFLPARVGAHGRQLLRVGTDPRLDRGQHPLLPVQPLDLPDAQRNQNRAADQAEQQREDVTTHDTSRTQDAGERPPRQLSRRPVGSGAAPDIDRGEEEEPHHIDEMPVPGRRLEAHMLFGRHLPAGQPDQADEQEDRADDDMGAMEPRRHEEGVPVERTGADRLLRVQVFKALQRGEAEAEDHGENQPVDRVAAVVLVHQRVVRPGQGDAREQQDHGVDQRQVPGVEDLGAGGRPDAVLQRIVGAERIHRVLEEVPEPDDEEHHLGHDEEDEAIAQSDPHDRRMLARLALAHHVGPPADHAVEHQQKPRNEGVGGDVLHPEHRAEQHDEGAKRAQQRPDRRRQDLIVVVAAVGHVGAPVS